MIASDMIANEVTDVPDYLKEKHGLKGCPFCGTEPKWEELKGGPGGTIGYLIGCLKCGISLAPKDENGRPCGQEECVKRWNNRAEVENYSIVDLEDDVTNKKGKLEDEHGLRLKNEIHGALKNTLNEHGKIVKNNMSSATKRVFGSVQHFLSQVVADNSEEGSRNK